MESRLERVRELLSRHPRVTRLVVMATLVVIVGWPLSRLVPRGLDVHFDLGEQHADYELLRVAYLPVGQDSARAMTRRFPQGAPRTFLHHVDLAPGRYEIHARLEGRGSPIDVVQHVDVGRSTEVGVVMRERSIFNP